MFVYILLLIPFFFMYVFPLFFLREASMVSSTPTVATVLLAVGTILWTLQSVLIAFFITKPRKHVKRHQKVQKSGKLVEAKILSYEKTGEMDGMPKRELLLSFLNLAGYPTKVKLTVVDSKPHENRYEPGNYIDLRLNQNGFKPPFAMVSASYKADKRLWAWVLLIFNIAYAVGLFLLSYKQHSGGNGLLFLHPASPWMIAPITGIALLALPVLILLPASKNADDIIRPGYALNSMNSIVDFGELLLYGHAASGEILNYAQTSVWQGPHPQIQFDISIKQEYGEPELLSSLFGVQVADLHKLRTGEVEVLYLPNKKNAIMLDYTSDH